MPPRRRTHTMGEESTSYAGSVLPALSESIMVVGYSFGFFCFLLQFKKFFVTVFMFVLDFFLH